MLLLGRISHKFTGKHKRYPRRNELETAGGKTSALADLNLAARRNAGRRTAEVIVCGTARRPECSLRRPRPPARGRAQGKTDGS